MSGESLIAAPRDTASPLSGTLLLEDGAGLVSAINSRSWVDAAVSGAATALDAAAAVANPLATVVAMGVGWVLDHIEPLKSWLNDLTGDAGQVQAFAGTWHNIDAAIGELAGRLERRVTGDLYEIAGAAADAYRALQADLAKMLGAAGTWAGAMGTGLEIAATIVQAVHDIVRDAISQIGGMAVQSAAEVALSGGLATPAVVARVATKTASTAASIGRKVTGVERSLRSLEGLLEKLKRLFHDLGGKLAGVLHGGGGETARSGRTGAAAALTVESSEFDHFVAFFDGRVIRSIGILRTPRSVRAINHSSSCRWRTALLYIMRGMPHAIPGCLLLPNGHICRVGTFTGFPSRPPVIRPGFLRQKMPAIGHIFLRVVTRQSGRMVPKEDFSSTRPGNG